MCRSQGLAGSELGLVGVGWEQLALDVVLGLWRVTWLQKLEQVPKALVLCNGHWLQIAHNHLSYSFRDQNLRSHKTIKCCMYIGRFNR